MTIKEFIKELEKTEKYMSADTEVFIGNDLLDTIETFKDKGGTITDYIVLGTT